MNNCFKKNVCNPVVLPLTPLQNILCLLLSTCVVQTVCLCSMVFVSGLNIKIKKIIKLSNTINNAILS